MFHRIRIGGQIERLLKILNRHINFNLYSELNPDILSAGMHPIHHFVKYGWRENRFVAKELSANELLSRNKDLSTALRFTCDSRSLTVIDSLFDLSQPSTSKNDVRFIGYVESKLGLGTATRSTINCFSSLSSRFSIYPYSHGASDRYDHKFMPDKYDTHRHHKINIFELGLDHVGLAFDEINGGKKKKSYNILRLYWELPHIPIEKMASLNRYDEIWAPSKFVYEAVSKVFTRKVFIVPPYIDKSGAIYLDRKNFGLSDKTFYFLFSFDYNSSIYRKNPFAVIRAFRDAFPQTESSVGLIIKTNNPANSSMEAKLIHDSAKSDSRILIIDDYFDRNRMLSLTRCCDCYVSLHRSEGYGMGMAEAIRLGRKVVATNYSGNIDFMNRHNSFPVDYSLIQVEAHQYPHSEGNTWADPSHESAVQQLRKAFHEKTIVSRDLITRLSFPQNSLPSKKHLAKMIFGRVRAILKENGSN